LVEQVDLRAARCAERHLAQQIAHVVDLVVGRGVELAEVERRARLDRLARRALAARLAIDRALTVEHLAEDAGEGGLARASRPRQQVGVPDATLADRVLERLHDVALPTNVGETTGAIPPVEGLVLHDGRSLPTEHARSRA